MFSQPSPKPKRLRLFAFGCLGALIVLGIAGVFMSGLLNSSAQNPPYETPLLINVLSPLNGRNVAAGEQVTVLVDAAGAFPLSRISLMLNDSEGSQTAAPTLDLTSGESQARTTVALAVPAEAQGTYTLVARVTDSAGNTAVSNIVNLTVKGDALYEQVAVESWEEVEAAAQEHSVPIESVVALNPQLIQEPDAAFQPTTIDLPPAPAPVPPESPGGPPSAPEGPSNRSGLWDLLKRFRPPDEPPGPPQWPQEYPPTAHLSDCAIQIVIEHERTPDESKLDGYFLYRALPGAGDFERIATLRPVGSDPKLRAEYTDPLVRMGTYMYYASTYNSAGETPGEIVHVQVLEDCAKNTGATPPHWSAASLQVTGETTNKLYCYAATSTATWVRIPEDPTQFLVPGTAGIVSLQDALPAFYVDPSYTKLLMQCWGWRGGMLVDLGSIQSEFQQNASGQWTVYGTDDQLAFNGDLNLSGGKDWERVYVPPPRNVRVVGAPAACAEELKVKRAAQFCNALLRSNSLIAWDWGYPQGAYPIVEMVFPSLRVGADYLTIEAPLKYVLYRVEPKYLAHPVQESIPHPTMVVGVPRTELEECYYLKAYFVDQGGYAHYSGPSKTVCVPPLDASGQIGKQILTLEPAYVYRYRIDEYSLEGTKKGAVGGGLIDCGRAVKSDVAYAVDAREVSNAMYVRQGVCEGFRYELFAPFELAPLTGKQILSAEVRFDRLPVTNEEYHGVYHPTCLSEVMIHNDHGFEYSTWDPGGVSLENILGTRGLKEHFEYDVTRSVLNLLALGPGQGGHTLLLGLVPETFKSRSEYEVRSFPECEAKYGNFVLEVTYFEYH